MTDLIFFVLACFGLMYVVGHSVISLPAREWIATPNPPKPGQPIGMPADLARWRFWILALVECPACLGFWIGAISALLGWTPITVSVFSGSPRVVYILAWGLFIAGTNYVLAKLSRLVKDST